MVEEVDPHHRAAQAHLQEVPAHLQVAPAHLQVAVEVAALLVPLRVLEVTVPRLLRLKQGILPPHTAIMEQ